MDERILPETCQLDRKRLSTIEDKIDQILMNQSDFVSISGPLGKVRDQVQEIGANTASAHRRIDVHDVQIKGLNDRQWQIVWKVVAGIGAAGAALVAIIKTFGAL